MIVEKQQPTWTTSDGKVWLDKDKASDHEDDLLVDKIATLLGGERKHNFSSMYDHSGTYNRGYRAAIKDFMKQFGRVEVPTDKPKVSRWL